MRIVFAGTPEYAVPSLCALAGLQPAHEVVAVVTQPDRPKGRSKTPMAPPVKSKALELGLPPARILQPPSINTPETLAALRALDPDLLCVVAFGGILKREMLALPKRYPLNAHGSLLPRFRGAAPVQAALLAGAAKTGVTIMALEPALDSGPVLFERSIPILPTDTAGVLHDKLSVLSATCFVEALRQIEAGQAVFTPQDHTQATFAPKLAKDSGTLDWMREAVYLERFVRAMTPWPGAWTTLSTREGQARVRVRVRVADATLAEPSSGAHGSVPGEGNIARVAREASALVRPCLEVSCGGAQGTRLRLWALQPEGGREMSVEEFLNGAGRAFAQGCRLG